MTFSNGNVFPGDVTSENENARESPAGSGPRNTLVTSQLLNQMAFIKIYFILLDRLSIQVKPNLAKLIQFNPKRQDLLGNQTDISLLNISLW